MHPSLRDLTIDRGQAMDRNVLKIFVGALAVTLVLLIYALYQQQQQLNELVIIVGDGISIEKK